MKKSIERLNPEKELGRPVRRFEDTFSAVQVIKEMFFTEEKFASVAEKVQAPV